MLTDPSGLTRVRPWQAASPSFATTTLMPSGVNVTASGKAPTAARRRNREVAAS